MTFPETLKNPYSGYGRIVFGDRFIGRKKELNFITERIINNSFPYDIAIVGAPKIGKSSLVYEALIERKKQLFENKKIPIWINLGTYDIPESFFSGIVFRTYIALEDLGVNNGETNKFFLKIKETKLSEDDRFFYIQKFFETCKKMGFNIIFIFDEFDHARKLFKGNLSSFQKLRELTYNPDWKTSHITISRRSLREIEQQSNAISNYYSLFHEYPLISYNSDGLTEYFGKIKNCGIELDSNQIKKIDYYCGNHSYLLDIAYYHIGENYYETPKLDVDVLIQLNENLFYNYYENMLVHLKANELFDNLLQILFGPLVNVNKNDISKLKKYGFLSEMGQGSIISFSQDFNEYLYLIQRKIELWPT
jgi:hypothetical protein